MKFKTLIMTVLILVFAVSAFSADLAVRVKARGTAGDYDWARGVIVWSSTTYSSTDKIHARALGVPTIGFMQMMPFGNNIYTAVVDTFGAPKDSVGISLYVSADDSSGTGIEMSGSTSGVFTYFVMSK